MALQTLCSTKQALTRLFASTTCIGAHRAMLMMTRVLRALRTTGSAGSDAGLELRAQHLLIRLSQPGDKLPSRLAHVRAIEV